MLQNVQQLSDSVDKHHLSFNTGEHLRLISDIARSGIRCLAFVGEGRNETASRPFYIQIGGG
jgi:hypothetical protein